jgi:hypothetical protein
MKPVISCRGLGGMYCMEFLEKDSHDRNMFVSRNDLVHPVGMVRHISRCTEDPGLSRG